MRESASDSAEPRDAPQARRRGAPIVERADEDGRIAAATDLRPCSHSLRVAMM
jgi:hypothetical protein